MVNYTRRGIKIIQMNLKCKAESCPLKQNCKTFDNLAIKTVGVHYQMNPHYYDMGIFVCHQFVGDTQKYLQHQAEHLKNN